LALGEYWMGPLEDDKRSRNLEVEVVECCTWPFGVVMVEDEEYMLEVIRELTMSHSLLVPSGHSIHLVLEESHFDLGNMRLE
jgi:hypothetical protein